MNVHRFPGVPSTTCSDASMVDSCNLFQERYKTKPRSYKLDKKHYMIMVLGYPMASCIKELVRARYSSIIWLNGDAKEYSASDGNRSSESR